MRKPSRDFQLQVIIWVAAMAFSTWHIFVHTLDLSCSAYKQVVWVRRGISLGSLWLYFQDMLLKIMAKFPLIEEGND